MNNPPQGSDSSSQNSFTTQESSDIAAAVDQGGPYDIEIYLDGVLLHQQSSQQSRETQSGHQDQGEGENGAEANADSDTGDTENVNDTYGEPPYHAFTHDDPYFTHDDPYYYRPVRRSSRLERGRGALVYQRRLITRDSDFVRIPVYEPSLSRPAGFDVWNSERPPSPNEYLSDDESTSSVDPVFSLTASNSDVDLSDSLTYDESVGSDLSLLSGDSDI